MGAFVMPSLGADMEAGTLVEWLKKPGETVGRGDIVAVVETQKGAIEIESFQEGVLQSYLVDLGARVPVGTPLAVILGEGESPAAPETPAAADEKPAEPEPAAPEPAALPREQPVEPPARAAPAPVDRAGRAKVSPAARRLAAQLGIDPATLEGSGPQGAVVLADVAARAGAGERPAEAAPTAARPAETGGMREAIAAAMSRSKREIPHYYLSQTVDLTRAEAFVAETNAGRAPAERLLAGALYLKAVALAARKYPEFNGHFVDGRFEPGEAVHGGMAVNIRGGGLVAPAIHDADTRDLDALMAAMRDLVARVRAGRFRAAELSDPTITVSSLGERGVETLYGVIYPPQVAIVGFGTAAERVLAVDGRAEVRRAVTVTLAADHRVSDGHRGALFLQAIDKFMQRPEAL